MTKSTSNQTNSNVSILSNSNEKYSKIKNEIRQQAIADVLNFDKRDLTDINNTIKKINDLKEGKLSYIQINSNGKKVNYKELQQYKNFGNIFGRYEGKDGDKKEKMYMEIAERIILDRGGIVEYKDGVDIGKEKITEDFVRNEYNLLNEEDKYKDRLDFFTVKDKNGKLYIIKWKAEELRKIKEKEEELKNEEIERLQKENENLKESSTKKSDGENNEEGENEKKDNENQTMEALIKKLMEDSEKKDKKNEARFAKLEELLKNKDKKTNEESNDTDEKNIDEKNNKNNDELEDSETLDENSNYISRNFVEGLIVGIRGAEGYPKGTIRIREEVINVEEFEFYEEFKQEYIEAKGDATKLSRLDKEFAEMIILFSPKGADYKDKYCIKLSEAELKDGLYVSEERLARYGVRIDVTKYEREVIEKEIIRERKIVEKIETTITELQTQILELTTSISIEKYNKETILKEIKSKKELLAILIKRYKALQLSLKGLDSDEELKHLKEDKKKLQKELKELKKQKNVFNKIEEAINSMPNGEFIRINTKDGKVCWLQNVGEKFSREDHAGLIEEDIKQLGAIKKSQLLEILQKSDNVKEIIIGQENMPKKPQKFSIPENINDIDTKIADIEKQLADIKEKIKQKEANNKKRVVVEEFDDSDGGAWFARYCEENGIKRKDGKKISRRGGMDTSAIYVDKNGKELKLEWNDGADQHDDAGSHTKYELVYYEESGNGAGSELEAQLTIIIKEWEALLTELTELERSLMIEKEEEIKLTIKQRIEEINKKLVIISQKYTKFEQFIHTYKSRVTIKKYKIFQIIPNGPTPVPNKPFEMTSVISDMGTDVFKEKAALKVEEELKRQYKSLGRWQMGSRLALFLGRGSKRKKMMKNEMNSMANTAFQTNAAYATLNEQSQNAADRHGHELLTNMAAVNRITTVHNPQVDQLCKDYLNGRETDATFQTKFNAIVAADANIQNALRGQNITHIGTNILLQLKEHLALKNLINRLDGELHQYIATHGNKVHKDNMENFVEQYIRDYQKTPAFMAIFEPFIKSGIDSNKSLEKYLRSQQAIMKMQITNLTMNIDILNKGKSAYQIDNKDREKGWKYKVGHFLDKHPRGTTAGSVALAVGLGVVTAGTSAVVGAAISTGVFGSYVGFTNYIKKWTHHTKEQNTHEKNVVTDYRNEQAKIQNWQNDALNGSWRRKYKAKRQLALYDQTTQENIKLSDQITEYITNLSAKIGPLTADEENFMKLNLIEGWARLKYYREMGHNFLASENVDKTEEDMRRLEKAITLGLQKIGQNTNDIEQNMTATNPQRTNITYAVIKNDLKASYNKSLIQFKRERRNLALKYGIGTAAASIGASLAFQYAFGNGIFSKETNPFHSTTTTAEHYGLGKYNELNVSDTIANDTNRVLSSISPSDAKGANLAMHYGGGTDATRYIGTPPTASDLSSKVSAVKSYISGLPTKANGATGPGLTATDKGTFLSELGSLSGGVGTNGVLQNMRHADDIGQLAKGLCYSGQSGIFNPVSLSPNPALDVVGTTTHTAADRVANAVIEVSKKGVPGKKCRFFGVPLFFNTFKKRKSTKDTTDQNFGQGNNQQRPQQPNQPQPNQNQPQNP